MTTKEIVLLKCIGIGITVFFGFSFTWISLLFLYGLFYQLVKITFLEKFIHFEWFVIIISTWFIYLIMKYNKSNFLSVLLQDIGLIVFSFPLFSMVLSLFGVVFDDEVKTIVPIWIMIVLTVITININHRIKQGMKRKPYF